MLPEFSVRWHAVPEAALAWREWSGETVVFNDETCSTHLLNELAAEVLRLLVASRGGMTIATLAKELGDNPEGEDVSRWTRAIAGVLSEFARVGLAHSEPL